MLYDARHRRDRHRLGGALLDEDRQDQLARPDGRLGDEPALHLDDRLESEAGLRIFYLDRLPSTIAAFLLSPDCADPLYRRSVKVSMGAVFAVPYARITNWYDAMLELRDAGFQVLALTPAADARARSEFDALMTDHDMDAAETIAAAPPSRPGSPRPRACRPS